MLSLATRPRTPRRSAPGSRLRRGPRLGALLLCAWLCGCGGAYADAISRGDKYAQTGMWDEAAAAYEAAIRLDPSETEGQIKLQQARQRQAAERLQRATALESRGELAAALELVQQAARFDPASTPAQQALTRMSEAALDEAEKLLSGGQPAKAFSLTALVMKGAPRHTRAKRLDAQARSVLAEQAFGRAQAYLEGGKQGNALVELAACMTYRPDFPDARLHFGKVKLALQRELRFRVVLSPFPGKGEAGPLAQGLKPALLGQALDERLLLEVVAERPKEPSPGVALAGSFSDYELAHTQRKDMHSCDYVCGTDSKPNPERARIEQEVGRAEEELGRREQEAARSEQEVLRYQQEVDRTGGSVDGKAAEVERARSELDRCRAQAKPGDTSACSSQESSLRSAQSSLESERNRLSGPRSSLDSARSRLEMARQARESARQDREQKTRQLHDTLVMITVDRYCPFEYSIETHRVLAQTKLVLTMERLG
ncbi:MAG: hypothetical protein HY744_10625 [Deltaproteobacteria bacterium]|nr:hypothetical protein [Deltaproteobacteria bacterium]